MSPEQLKKIIKAGEGIHVEFKEASFELPKSVFETVCAMLNREGGHLFLGVSNNGKIEGLIEDCIADIKSRFVSSVNNLAQLNPKYYLNIHEVSLDEKMILYTYIPESSQVHSYLGKVYDRNEDGDFDISNNPDLVRQLHFKKQGSFSENTIYPAITISDLRVDVIQRCRTLANNNRPNHDWMELDDMAMLRSANLWKKDWKTGNEGFTLAAALLLGKDEVIQQILPHYKTDAILRKDNTDRYDDRFIVKTNLIESYDGLMGFIAKHLSDKFYMEGDQRISVRDKIFREVIANTLIHREYINEYPAKLIIEKNQVTVENWNRPHGSGKLKLDTFSPFPKNPVLASFFREIGRAEELGSGFRNTAKYTRIYTPGLDPIFEEGDVFRITIPLAQSNEGANEGTVEGTNEGTNEGTIDGTLKEVIEKAFPERTENLKESLVRLLHAIILNEGKRIPEYAELTKTPSKTTERHIQLLRDADLIEFIGEAYQTGGYIITEKLKIQIKEASKNKNQ